VLGRGLKKEKKFQEARLCYENAVKYRPNFALYKHSYAYMLVFYPYFNSVSNFKRANTLAESAVYTHPVNKEFVEVLACSYALLGQFDKALQVINKLTFPNTELIEAFRNRQSGRGVYKVVD
jgi:tetratricopeptide (TPR) repeat protein